MGWFLNTDDGASEYQGLLKETFFVDKTNMIGEILPRFDAKERYLCVTRPRRFGKSINASMLAAFLGKHPCPDLFADLNIASHPDYAKHLNQHNVVFFTIEDKHYASVTDLITDIESKLFQDLKQTYPDLEFANHTDISDAFKQVRMSYPDEKFVFIIDEWDAAFYFKFTRNNPDAKEEYQNWLLRLLKGKTYVEFAYLTGIRPVSVATSGSALNMFKDLTLLTDHELRPYFGFTQKEVDKLYQKYLTIHGEPKITLEGLASWYNGYDTTNGLKLYNPRSVCLALEDNALQSYWTSTGPEDEIYQQVKNNIPEMFDLIPQFIAGKPVLLGNYSYNALTGTPKTRDEILSAMLAYGFLTIKGHVLRVPNHELMLRFVQMVQTEPPFVEGLQLAKFGAGLVEAISQGDTDTVAAMIEQAHNRFSSQQSYSTEQELAGVVKYAFCCTPNYGWATEVTAGRGRADLVLFPLLATDDLIIIELKVDASPQQAIEQIKSRNYQELAAAQRNSDSYTGRIIAVGISYNRKDPAKQHSCAIEILREAQVN